VAAPLVVFNREGQELSTRDMQKMVQALPQYRDQLDKLSLHIHIATLLNAKIKQDVLSDIGNLEQDFVYGDATIKELINILNVNQEMSSENKLRLLMIYTVTHPEKLDETKQMQWMKVFLLFPLYLLLFPHHSSTYCHLEQVYTICVVHEQRLLLQVCFS
jgi:syntaxin-binding protein 1